MPRMALWSTQCSMVLTLSSDKADPQQAQKENDNEMIKNR